MCVNITRQIFVPLSLLKTNLEWPMSQYCLLTAENNTVQKNPQQILEFCTFGGSP